MPYLQILILIISLLGAFFFAGSETGFVSWNPLKVAHRAGLGHVDAKWALYLMNHKDRLISAVLIGNNVCVVSATLAFLALYEMFDAVVAVNLSRIPSPESWVLTPVLVLFGEMLPKSLFRTYPFRLTMRSVPVLMIVYYITLPVTWFFSLGTNIFQKTPREKGESFMTKVREEMVLIAVEGSKEGTLFESAKDLIDSVLKLKDRHVKDLMLALPEWPERQPVIRATALARDARALIVGHDELVVFNDSGDAPAGYVTVLDLMAADKNAELKTLLRQLPAIQADLTLLASLQKIEERSPRFFAVLDGANTIYGILDRMDLFKAAFGRISPDFNPKLA